MSIRTVLVACMLAVALVPAALIGAIGVVSINTSVRGEAQSRVNQHLEIVAAGYRDQLARLAYALESSAGRVSFAPGGLSETLAAVKRELDLTVLNLCDSDGRPIAGTHPDPGRRVPLERDPVLRKALEGKTAWGTVLLEPERLKLEGGAALQNAAVILEKEEGGDPVDRSALMWWIARPVTDENGLVTALIYGGRLLNFNYGLVDNLRDTVFSEKDHKGKPRGTVTIFMGDVRAATNVLTQHNTRAIGTRVSETVRETVLEKGMNYSGEALVVDAWYLSAYTPLRDPSGKTIGMIYVGLLRDPYDEIQDRLIARFLLPVAAVGLIAICAALWIVNRITRPVLALSQSASRLATGDLEDAAPIPHSYRELKRLSGAFAEMRAAIRKRDQELRTRNEELSLANTKLEQSNKNYMQTLGFVTHELKAPLAAIQMLIATMLDGYLGQVSPQVADFFTRIQRNCEELQDMVRDYLDLSRLERGELAAVKSRIDLHQSVVEMAVDQAAVFFRSRNIALSVTCPAGLTVLADPGLLRIALNNFLTNAAKYGRENGQASLAVTVESGIVTLSVRNDGAGFPPAEAERLFEKFYRVRDAHTHSKRGSGIGLFTVKHIAELHGGRVWAECEPGAWAAFHFSFPIAPPAGP
ncbi:MAG: cache domain-containing protein [Desulfobacterales bacterium]|jgi:two-component system NtrC family sensor kinase|nr:cache domain-containing protein [Desulfobacterales bacterium]